ncbi:MAG: hypothetical protein JWQ19_2572 [Subtercola sp.]|nr:hypothetical protein [Subtercola sp.]
MQLSTSEAARELGVSPRQVRRIASSDRIVANRIGASHSISTRQVQALSRTMYRGRNWSEDTRQAALDLLASGATTRLAGSERSRLKMRIRTADPGSLAGQILREHTSLRRAATPETKIRFSPTLLGELGLSAGGGLGVLVARDAASAARRERLGLDDSGDIAVVEGDEQHQKVLEALVLYAFGDARENAAATNWIRVRAAL